MCMYSSDQCLNRRRRSTRPAERRAELFLLVGLLFLPARFTGFSPEFQQNSLDFARISPEFHQNVAFPQFK